MRRLFVLVALCLLFARPAFAQIAFDAAAGGSNGGAGGNFDFTGLTIGSGSNRAIVVTITANANSTQITGATWDQGGTNQAMTQVGGSQIGGSARYMWLFLLLGPTSGNKTLRVFQSGGDYIQVAAASYTGVQQTGQPDSQADHAGQTPPVTATTTVVAANCWLIGGASDASTGSTLAAGSGTSLRATDSPNNIEAIFDSNGTVGTGSQSLHINNPGGSGTVWNVLSLAPDTGGGGGGPSACHRSLLGVGCDPIMKGPR
jgi:hypothetical protein